MWSPPYNSGYSGNSGSSDHLYYVPYVPTDPSTYESMQYNIPVLPQSSYYSVPFNSQAWSDGGFVGGQVNGTLPCGNEAPSGVPYTYSSTEGANGTVRPKRASNACQKCRLHKNKCDERRPECTYCSDNTYYCIYNEDPIPKKEQRQNEKLARYEILLERAVTKTFDEATQNVAAESPVHWPAIQKLIPRNHKVSYITDNEEYRTQLCLHSSGVGGDTLSLPLSPHSGQLFDAGDIDGYLSRYLENIHLLHPFLMKRDLCEMVNTFKERLNKWVGPSSGAKRKRDISLPDNNSTYCMTQPTALIKRSIASAIVLLVLALGDVLTYWVPLPASTLTDSSKKRTAPNHKVDATPGLSYFAKAMDILSGFPGGAGLPYVQANLFAGLYMGRLGWVLASHSFIHNACTACQFIIKSTPYQERFLPRVHRGLINIAFWSCIELESDLLAVVDAPASGIVNMEPAMQCEMPTYQFFCSAYGNDEIVRYKIYQYWLTRVQLRTYLNKNLHRDNDRPSKKVVTMCTSYLDDCRQQLARWNWNWDDNNHQSSDIDIARFQENFYEAAHLMYRPVLRYALNLSTSLLDQNDGPEEGARPPPWSLYESLPEWMLSGCQKGINAAINSIASFDKVPRLVATNIFGTAHALVFDGEQPLGFLLTNHRQFNHILILAATYCSRHPQLRSLVDEGQLRDLLNQTIAFLEMHEAMSPNILEDAIDLRYIQSRLFNVPSPTTTSSSLS